MIGLRRKLQKEGMQVLLLCLMGILVGACGKPARDNPVDPRGDGNSLSENEIQLIASLPDIDLGNADDRLFEFRYGVSEINEKGEEILLAGGEMTLVGERARALVRGLSPGNDRIFQVNAFDASQIRTFSAVDTVDVGKGSPQVVLLSLERLKGDLEFTAELPPEIESLEVVIAADGDSLWQLFDKDEQKVRLITDIPTGADVRIIFRGRDGEDQVLIQRQVSADIRKDLLARLTLSVEIGALQIVAHFPEYIPIVEIDRFSDLAGVFFRRSEIPTLPDSGAPIDFDDERFLMKGFGPNGETVEFYHFDVRSNVPAPVYIVIDQRGNPILGQLPIFDLLPGEEGHSDLWLIHHVQIQERDFKPNSLTSYQPLIESEYEITPTGEVMNCVMVPDGSTASRRYDPGMPISAQDGWYRDQIVKYLLFENPNSLATVAFSGEKINTPQMYAFLENDRDLLDGFARDKDGITHNVISVLPPVVEEQADYSPLWLLRILKLNSFDLVDNLPTASDQTAENLNTEIINLNINAPVVGVE